MTDHQLVICMAIAAAIPVALAIYDLFEMFCEWFYDEDINPEDQDDGQD